MGFLPPGEHIEETKICPVSGEKFFVTNKDIAFYDTISPILGGKKYAIPSPTLCPEERKRRRFTWRNERHLYHRKCDLTKRQMISIYDTKTPIPVYDLEAWFSDEWNAALYARNFSFDEPFFVQFSQLDNVVPQLGISVWFSENSNYCNYVGHVKNSYLIFGSVYSEDCYYGSPYYSKHCLDTLVVRNCEFCYQCIDSRELSGCFWCQDCHSSSGLIYCFDCKGCTNCIGCAGLRNQNFYIFNQRVTQQQYDEFIKAQNPFLEQNGYKIQEKLTKLRHETPHKHYQGENNEGTSGNYIYNCKEAYECFYTDKSEYVKYCQQVVDLKNCHDNNYTEENEWCLDYLGAYQNHNLLFSRFCNQVRNGVLLNSCHASHNLFACSGLRNSHHCILNKPYSIQEYETLCGKIIDHMRSTGEWGEFFPHELSPFGYDETVAQEYFPMTEEEVQAKGWNWKGEEETSSYHGPYYTPLPIDQYDEKIVGYDVAKKNIDELLSGILCCEITKKPFKVIRQELAFYIENHIPIPTKHPDQRHKERMEMRNPRKLFERKCSECQKEIITTYAPERPEKVVCEGCYQKLVY